MATEQSKKAKAAKAAATVKKANATPRIGGSGDYVYIVSTMANAVSYNAHITIDGVPRIDPERSITIRGGAGLPSQTSGFGEIVQNEANQMPMWTPKGAVTPILRERYAILKDHWLFKKHLEKGYVTVVEDPSIMGNHSAVKKIVEGMETDDPRAPLNEQSFKRYAAKVQGKNLKIATDKNAASMEKIENFG
jgi:hypothetical protein